jgi:hypothetical protein
MDKDVARTLLILAKSLDEVIVKMFEEVEKIADDGSRARFHRAVGDLIGRGCARYHFPH